MPKLSGRERAAKWFAINTFLGNRHRTEYGLDAGYWVCCSSVYTTLETVSRHIHAQHQTELDAIAETYLRQKEKRNETEEALVEKFKKRRAEKGTSDPVILTCTCDSTLSTVILFYKYIHVPDPVLLAAHHYSLCTRLNLTGKIRIAIEGINATLAGNNASIATYIDWITQQSVLASDNLSPGTGDPEEALSLERRRRLFFKPSPGCTHVFSALSVKVVNEICPLGVSSIRVEDSREGKLSPAEFHRMLLEAQDNPDEYVCLDTRNYYESRIGRFEGAVCPPIRKFSAFPDFVKKNRETLQGRTVLAYCTGGIRCEKATVYLRQTLSQINANVQTQILMLDGGIHNYLEWVKEQQKQPWTASDQDPDSDASLPFSPVIDPLWHGKNYIFDARQSLGLSVDGSDDGVDIISECQFCASTREDRYVKCAGTGCHLLVLCCDACHDVRFGGRMVFCCEECEQGEAKNEKGGKGLCRCEKERKAKESIGMLKTGEEGK